MFLSCRKVDHATWRIYPEGRKYEIMLPERRQKIVYEVWATRNKIEYLWLRGVSDGSS